MTSSPRLEHLVGAIEAARLAIEQSRGSHYLNEHGPAAAQLSAAILRLEEVKAGVRSATISEAGRKELLKAVEGLRLELRNAEALHAQAAALRSGWARALAGTFSIEPGAGYGPDALHGLASPAGRISWDG